ncbi:MAG: FAD-dependent oxidoreductase, partial [Deltaproteobacteria bacterium]|nr:FAD-dependent oxidoreductase [Deltaproteobacteria bacterium]
KEVTIIEMLSELGMDMEPFDRYFFLERFAESGVKTLTNTKVEEITDQGVSVINSEGKKQDIEAASIVLAMGSMANSELWENLRNEMTEIYVIGDSRAPRKLYDAVHEGSHVAREI